MMKNKIWPILGITTSVLVPLSSCATKTDGRAKDDRPNVIIILADDIGYGDLGFNGEPTVQTPNADRVANSGIRFTDAHSVAATSTPSRYSLLTGHYAWRRNDTGIAAGNAGMIIRPEQHTIANLFQDNGYKTAAIGKWHLGLGDKTGEQDWNKKLSPGPADIGFEYSYIMAATGDRVPCVFVEDGHIVNLDAVNDPIEVDYEKPFPGEPLGRTNPELLTVQRPSHGHDMAVVNGISRIGYMKGGKSALWRDETIADSITAHAVSFIDANKDKPFFMYFATNDIHVPRVPNPRFVGKSGMGPRGDAILEFDWSVGQILDALDKNDLTHNTIIIITSDNGPVVDDGYIDQAVELLGNHRPGGEFRGGKYSAFEAGTRVPMVLSWPKHNKKSKVSDALVSQIDFYATLAAILDVAISEGAAPDSKNDMWAYLGESDKGRPYVIEQSNTLSISNGQWKYIMPNNGAKVDGYTNTELGNDTLPQLYHLNTDKGEMTNLAKENPGRIAGLKALLDKELAKGKK